MAGYSKRQGHLRRLYCAPDSTHEFLATCDKPYVPHLTYHPASQTVTVDGPAADAAPRVALPFPALDLAWCPFKKGTANASFITACRDQPLQLWDCEDAELRASYVAANDSDYHVHAHAVCWFASAAHPHWIAGGYGGFEDSTQVRLFDVVAEGSQPVWTYTAPRRKGLVSTLLECAWPGTAGAADLLAVGFHNASVVHLIDCRHRCPAAELSGLQCGVRTLRLSAQEPMLIYGGGNPGDSRVACWDIRSPRSPLFTLTRPANTSQVFDFHLLPCDANAPGAAKQRRLVSASSEGGVVVYEWSAGEAPAADAGTTVGSSVGPTSGLAVVDAHTVVVTTGRREFSHRLSDLPAHTGGGKGVARTAAAAAVAEGEDNDEHDDVDDDCEQDVPHFPVHKRARSPMADDDDSDSESCTECLGGAAVDCGDGSAEATNAAVIVLP